MGKISFSASILCLRHTQKRGGVHFFLVYFPKNKKAYKLIHSPRLLNLLTHFKQIGRSRQMRARSAKVDRWKCGTDRHESHIFSPPVVATCLVICQRMHTGNCCKGKHVVRIK